MYYVTRNHKKETKKREINNIGWKQLCLTDFDCYFFNDNLLIHHQASSEE